MGRWLSLLVFALLLAPSLAFAPAPETPLCRDDVFAGVYRPERLELLHHCQWATGTVAAVRDEADGDVHVNLLLDPGQDALKCGRNDSAQAGALVLEIIPGDHAAIPAPAVGSHINVIGAHVRDTAHDWCELHPVWSLTVNDQTFSEAVPLNVPIPGHEDELDVAPAPQSCTYALGFAALHDLIPQIVGDCAEDEHHNPANGDGLQQTTNGLLVWRKADNWTAFTDGATTWINGPCGLQSRPNDQTFAWETGGSCASAPPATAPVVSPPAPTPPPASTVPANATAVCGDGTISYSTHAAGTCSGHGGVQQWIKRPPS